MIVNSQPAANSCIALNIESITIRIIPEKDISVDTVWIGINIKKAATTVLANSKLKTLCFLLETLLTTIEKTALDKKQAIDIRKNTIHIKQSTLLCIIYFNYTSQMRTCQELCRTSSNRQLDYFTLTSKNGTSYEVPLHKCIIETKIYLQLHHKFLSCLSSSPSSML